MSSQVFWTAAVLLCSLVAYAIGKARAKQPTQTNVQDSKRHLAHKTSIYQPLKNPRGEIRLLRFQHRENLLEPHSVSLATFPLDGPGLPAYVALSYEWNPKIIQTYDFPQKVIVNSTDRQITRNLGIALEALYSLFHTTTYFWVDAICVNQDNTSEKNHQVRLMGNIYQAARRVIVWPGFEAFAAKTEFLLNLLGVSGAERKLEMALLEPSLQEQWESMTVLSLSTYWKRCWIMQEIFFARECLVMLPTASRGTSFKAKRYIPVNLEDLTKLALQVNQCHVRLIDRLPEGNSNVLEALQKRVIAPPFHILALKALGERDLLSVLVMFAQNSATNPRDRVYALLGLAIPFPGISPLEIAYDESVQQVFKETALYIIQGSRNLELLCCAGHDDNEGLPSWAPKWDNWTTEDLVFFTQPGKMRAGGQFSRFSIQANKLITHAYFVSIPYHCALPSSLRPTENDSQPNITVDRARHLVSCLRAANSNLFEHLERKGVDTYFLYEPLFFALWFVMVFNYRFKMDDVNDVFTFCMLLRDLIGHPAAGLSPRMRDVSVRYHRLIKSMFLPDKELFFISVPTVLQVEQIKELAFTGTSSVPPVVGTSFCPANVRLR